MLFIPALRPLYTLWGEELPSFFLLMGLGIVVAVALGVRNARSFGLNPVYVLDLGAIVVLGGLFGAKFLHAIAEEPAYYFENFWQHPGRIFALWNGGFALLGSLFVAVPLGALYVRLRRMPFWQTADLAGLVFPLGIAIGRLGCVLAGCCYGEQTTSPLHFRYYIYNNVAPQVVAVDRTLEGIPLVPTQLYEALFCTAIFLGVRWYARRKAFHGAVFLLFLASYSVGRFFVEIWRADLRGGIGEGLLSTSQLISLAILLVVFPLLALGFRGVYFKPVTRE